MDESCLYDLWLLCRSRSPDRLAASVDRQVLLAVSRVLLLMVCALRVLARTVCMGGTAQGGRSHRAGRGLVDVHGLAAVLTRGRHGRKDRDALRVVCGVVSVLASERTPVQWLADRCHRVSRVDGRRGVCADLVAEMLDSDGRPAGARR